MYVMGSVITLLVGSICGREEETSVHILCECEALASLRHAHLDSFYLDPEDIMNRSIGTTWNFSKGTGLL